MVKFLLKFSDKIVDQPITSQVTLEYGVPINILSARINQQGGEILIDIPSNQADMIIKAFQKKGVETIVPKLIEIDDKLCFECGACISLCPVTAITFKEDLSIFLNETKCIGSTCGLCINACPVRAIRLVTSK